HVARPFVRLLELRRTRQPLPDVVGKMLEVAHCLAVLANLVQNLRIRRRKRTLIFRRRPRRSGVHTQQRHNTRKHNHSNSARAHSLSLKWSVSKFQWMAQHTVLEICRVPTRLLDAPNSLMRFADAACEPCASPDAAPVGTSRRNNCSAPRH